MVLGVKISVLVSAHNLEQVDYVDFFFYDVNLFASYKLSELTPLVFIGVLERFLKNDPDFQNKSTIIKREYKIETILSVEPQLNS